MNWPKPRLRKWLEVPDHPYNLSPQDLTKIVTALTLTHPGRQNIKDCVLKVLGVKHVVEIKAQRGGMRLEQGAYKIDDTEGEFFRELMKPVFDKWIAEDVARILGQARAEARHAADETLDRATGEKFLDTVVERINKKRVQP